MLETTFHTVNPSEGWHSSTTGHAASAMRTPFTAAQRAELEHQVLVIRYMMGGQVVPPDALDALKDPSKLPLLSPRCSPSGGPQQWSQRKRSSPTSSAARSVSPIKAGKVPDELRCHRTDGKNWRCGRGVVQGGKYCERHMNRGRQRVKKPVDGASNDGESPTGSASGSPTLGNGESKAGTNIQPLCIPGGKRGEQSSLDGEGRSPKTPRQGGLGGVRRSTSFTGGLLKLSMMMGDGLGEGLCIPQRRLSGPAGMDVDGDAASMEGASDASTLTNRGDRSPDSVSASMSFSSVGSLTRASSLSPTALSPAELLASIPAPGGSLLRPNLMRSVSDTGALCNVPGFAQPHVLPVHAQGSSLKDTAMQSDYGGRLLYPQLNGAGSSAPNTFNTYNQYASTMNGSALPLHGPSRSVSPPRSTLTAMSPYAPYTGGNSIGSMGPPSSPTQKPDTQLLRLSFDDWQQEQCASSTTAAWESSYPALTSSLEFQPQQGAALLRQHSFPKLTICTGRSSAEPPSPEWSGQNQGLDEVLGGKIGGDYRLGVLENKGSPESAFAEESLAMSEIFSSLSDSCHNSWMCVTAAGEKESMWGGPLGEALRSPAPKVSQASFMDGGGTFDDLEGLPGRGSSGFDDFYQNASGPGRPDIKEENDLFSFADEDFAMGG